MESDLIAIGSSVCRSPDEEENGIHACTSIPQKQKTSCPFSCKILLEGIPPSRRNSTTVCMCQTISELEKKEHNLAAKYCLIEITVVFKTPENTSGRGLWFCSLLLFFFFWSSIMQHLQSVIKTACCYLHFQERSLS